MRSSGCVRDQAELFTLYSGRFGAREDDHEDCYYRQGGTQAHPERGHRVGNRQGPDQANYRTGCNRTPRKCADGIREAFLPNVASGCLAHLKWTDLTPSRLLQVVIEPGRSTITKTCEIRAQNSIALR